MSKKSGGRGSRARGNRSPRPLPRPAADAPIEQATPFPAPASPPTATARPAARQPMSSIPPRTRRPARSGGLIPITDYSYVMTDLRRIAVLAAAAFVVLGGLTFVVH